jgi:Putative lumazine-binding
MSTVIGRRLAWLSVCLTLGQQPAFASRTPTDSAAVVAAIEEYHEGLRRDDPSRVSAVLGPSFTMFNGNFSGDPRTWEVHMYLAGPRLAEWPVNFLRQAGPYENQVQVLRVYVRGDAGLVVTEETGRNRFRQWNRELVTYLLGREGGRWRLVGYFIRDIANPK